MNAAEDNPLLDIARRLQLRVQLNERVTDALDDLSGAIRTHTDWFDKPDEVQDFIHKFREYIQSYSLIIQKIEKQIEDEITEEHIHSLRNISNRNDMERQRCFQFQRFAIARGANDAKAGPILQSIYTTIRDRIETDKDLGALIADMLRFVRKEEQQEQSAPGPKERQSAQEPRMALRSKDESDDSTGEQAYKIFVRFMIGTNLGRIIAFSAFVCIGIAFAMNYAERGPGVVDSIMQSEYEKETATLNGNATSNSSGARQLDSTPASAAIAPPTQNSQPDN